MGGTTAKAGASRDGRPEVVHEYEVGGDVHVGRVVKGSGYPVRFPFIDLAECSAGGGSIARVEDSGLRVGPTSAGADPGPACYRRGGEDPTITDANLILGRLPETLAQGFRLDPSMARDAMRERVADRLGIDVVEASLDVVDVADATMSRILRIVTVERGEDPRGHLLVAFGGAGPLHACALADGLGIGEVMVPMRAGLLSAVGQLSCPHTRNEETSLMAPVEGLGLEDAFRRLEADASLHVPDGEALRQLDMRYVGQSHELTIDVRGGIDEAVEDLRSRHLAVYGHGPDLPVEVVNARVRLSSQREAPTPKTGGGRWGRPCGHRDVVFRDGTRRCPVFRPDLVGEGPVPGPMTIDGYGSTLLVPEGWDVTSSNGDIMVRRDR